MPGIGLGANTPISLKLQRENYNALIGRHSQPLRWLQAEKCPCVGSNRKVDENCPLCYGKGIIYTQPTTSLRVEGMKAAIDGVIAQGNVSWVRDYKGNDYTITETNDCATFATGVIKGYDYIVAYTENVTQSGTGTATYIAESLYSIDLPVQVEFGTVQGDLISVTAYNGETELTVSSIWRNYFEIEEVLTSADEVTVEYTYINPFQFALIHNNFTKTDQKYLVDYNGDGLMIFPQRWEVAANDVIVALNATETKKMVLNTTASLDALPSYYVSELKSVWAIRSNVKHEFTIGTDVILYKDRQLKWLVAPTLYEQISVTYTYNVAYKVLGDMPDPRTSENNRFPRKVALKLYTDFNSREGF